MSAVAKIPYDAFILGRGQRSEDGSIHIEHYEVGGNAPKINASFVEKYKPLASDDLASQAFLSRATSVLRISVKDVYGNLGRKTGKKLGELLDSVGIEHLLMIGIESSYGLSWITLYRTNDSKLGAFLADECERALFTVRASLYEWQRSFGHTPGPVWEDRFNLVQLSPAVFETALWSARGYANKEIMKHLGLQEFTVADQIKTAAAHFKALGSRNFRQSLLERMLGPMPPRRIRE
jgi:hypothetical protein